MLPTIEQLSINQALHALLYFYEEIPHRLWPFEKPLFSRLPELHRRTMAEANGPENELLSEVTYKNKNLCSNLSKRILSHLERKEDYAPFVEGAIHYCTQPRMAPASDIVVKKIIVALSLLTLAISDEVQIAPSPEQRKRKDQVPIILQGAKVALK